MPRCAGKKADGTPCERIVGSSQEYCYAHDPSYAEDRKRAASKAAKSPARSRANSEIREIAGLLKDLYAAVMEGVVGRQDAAVCTQICNARLRAVELQHRVTERDELEGRWDELEAILEEVERRTHVRR